MERVCPLLASSTSNLGNPRQERSAGSRQIAVIPRWKVSETHAQLLSRALAVMGLRSVTEAARFLGVKRHYLFTFMDETGWTTRSGLRRLPSPEMVQKGYLDQQVTSGTTGEGQVVEYEQVLVTPSGIVQLAMKIRSIKVIGRIRKES